MLARKTAALIAASTLILPTAGCSGTAGGPNGGSLADMDPVTLALAELVAPETAEGEALQSMIDYIESETDGKITIEPYWSASLLDGTQMTAGLRDGVADMGRLSIVTNPTDFPIMTWFTGAMSAPPDSYPASNLTGVPTNIEIYKDPDLPFYQEFLDSGVVPLAMTSASKNEMLCSTTVTKPEDLEGASVRVPGEPWSGEVKALGMTPVSMPSSEMYEALERGVIDCGVVATTFFFSAGLWETGKTFLPLPMSVNSGSGLVINREVWESLPGEAQDIMRDALAIYAYEGQQAQVKEYSTVVETLEENGITLADPRPFVDALRDQQEKVLAEMVKTAPEGVDDPEGLIKTYQDSIAESEAALADLGAPVSDDLSPEALTASYESAFDDVDWDGFHELVLKALSADAQSSKK